MEKIGLFEFKLQSDYVDFTGRVSMKSLASIVLYCAGENAKMNGFGVEQLQKNGITWVLARLLIQMKSLPIFEETIFVETWISSINEHISERKMVFFDSQKQIIGYASSMWAILDMGSRKAAKLDQNDVLKGFVVERGYNIEDSERVRCTDGDHIASRKVMYSDLDINRHVNSVKYIEWVLNTIDIEQIEQKPFYGMLINYQYEVMYGDTITIKKSIKRENHYDIFRGDMANASKIRFWDVPFEL